jgi:hypothetical protein
MSSMPTVSVTPVSGSGWMVAGVPRELPPEPFIMAVQSSEPKRWLGLVLDSGHEFVGRHVELKQRYDEWTGEVEIIVEPAGPADRRSTGPGLICARPVSRISRY